MAAQRDLTKVLAPFPAGEPLLEAMENLRQSLAALDLTDADAIARRRRTVELLGLLESALSTTKTVLLTNSVLDSLRASVEATTAHVAYIAAPQDPSHYNNQLWALTDLVRPLMASAGTQKIPAMGAAALATIAASAQISEALAALDQERLALSDTVDKLSDEAEQLISDAGTRFDSVAKSGEAAYLSSIAKWTAAMEADRVSFVEAAEQTVNEGEEQLARLKSLLGVASDLTLSTDYGTQADAEARSARTLRRGALVAGVSAVVAGIGGVVLQALASARDWSGYDAAAVLPGKLAVIVALAAIAGYLGRQSSNHRRYSEHLRNAQLELRNLGPYLAELDREDQARIRGELVSKFFGRQGPSVEDDAPTTGASVDQLLELIRVFAKGK